MQDKMPGEFIWISEWASFNGDDRALSQQQLNMTIQHTQLSLIIGLIINYPVFCVALQQLPQPKQNVLCLL